MVLAVTMSRKKPKLRPDVNEIAFRTVQAAVGDAKKPRPPGTGEKNPEAVRRGRKGGKRGAKATPAMAAGVTDRVWTVEDLVSLLDPKKLLQTN